MKKYYTILSNKYETIGTLLCYCVQALEHFHVNYESENH